ncbi:MAG TPA: hypothetical protein VNH15_07710 [Elusimicrobiota bacterium]|nr:hypothetical protein [Elusimicrobiota bacterium]
MKGRLAMLAGAGLLMGLAACSGVNSRVRNGEVENVINQEPDHGGYLEAIGIGASEPSLPTQTQRMALARDAAIVKAQYELLSMVKGVELDGGVTVKQALESDSTLQAKLDEVIRGAEIVKSEFTADNGCVVTMRLPKSRLKKLMGVSFQ